MARPGDYNLGTRLETLRDEFYGADSPVLVGDVRDRLVALIDILLDALPDDTLNNERNYGRASDENDKPVENRKS